MTIVPLPATGIAGEADAPLSATTLPGASPSAASSFATALGDAFDSAGGALARADRSERAYVRGAGGLQEMVLDRAQADIALTIATTAASKASQALSTILGMQV